MPILFDARETLKRGLQTTDAQDDIRELLLVCRLFRLPIPEQNIEVEQLPIPGAYPLSPMLEENATGGLAPIAATTRKLVELVLWSKGTKEPSQDSADRLSDEILKRIFVLVHADNLLLHRPLTLINVSKRWRAVAFAIPSLWENLHITYGTSVNPFYSLIYHVFHAHDLRLWVHSPAVLASMTTLSAVIPPRIRSKLQIPQLKSLTLLGFGAIEAIDSFPFHYPNLTTLTLMDLRRHFPINLLSNCPALEILTMDCCIEVVRQKFLNEELPGCAIPCTSLDVVWSAKWVQFDIYSDNFSIDLLKSFSYTLIDKQAFNMLPHGLLARNPDIENLILRGVSLEYIDLELIREPFVRGLYPPLTDLLRVSKLELTDVDGATNLFQLCIEFPTLYFPRLASLYLTRVMLNTESLMDYIRMKTENFGPIPVSVSSLRVLSLKGILFEEEDLTELELVRTRGGVMVDISLQ